MSVIDFHSPLSVFVSVKGHPYQRDEFFKIFEEMDDVRYTAVEQPASQQLLTVEGLADYQSVLMYDMPGIDFATQPPGLVEPCESFKNGFLDLLDSGKGIVFLHHAIAGWPLWPEYAQIIGGRFWYLSGEYEGVNYQDSGYRHDVPHKISSVTNHPVLEGMPSSFELTDELYLFDSFEDDKIPLLVSDFGFHKENFYSATEAVARGAMYSRDNWLRSSGTSLVGWVKNYKIAR